MGSHKVVSPASCYVLLFEVLHQRTMTALFAHIMPLILYARSIHFGCHSGFGSASNVCSHSCCTHLPTTTVSCASDVLSIGLAKVVPCECQQEPAAHQREVSSDSPQTR
ncbi:hypothetical protein DOTSEDRAFT_67842, partial [Dothistroma septosporum NZE10]